jgi:phenylacetate-coenzyme A ligase PaaK-like adenylate-forming protein
MSSILDQINHYFDRGPYSDDKFVKEHYMLPLLVDLVKYHYTNCAEYRNILDALRFDQSSLLSIDDLPFLPVLLFKELDLISVPLIDISKTMRSSGTSGQVPSSIYLDKTTAMLQRKVLARITSEVIGTKRLPMVVVDKKSSILNRTQFSASTAAILGFSSFSRSQFFVLNEDMTVDFAGLSDFLKIHKDETIFLFGFTSIIWQYLILPLTENKKSLDFGNSVLIHGGGWKKLQNQNISRAEFRSKIHELLGVKLVHDYYGMVEQTGSIFIECSHNFFHTSNFSTVIVRDPQTHSVLPFNEIGIVKVVSIAPVSYPGHILLTEDLGRIVGEDNCRCGRLGRYFEIFGRVEHAELRGCSDTFSA